MLFLAGALPAAAGPQDTRVGETRMIYAKAGTVIRAEGAATAAPVATLPAGTQVLVAEAELGERIMRAFILRRVALIVPTFIGVTLIAFALIRLIPGDPVENLSGERGMDPARRERLLHEFGLDRPLQPRPARLDHRHRVGLVLQHLARTAAGVPAAAGRLVLGLRL